MELEIHSPKYGKFTVYYDEEDHDIVSKYTWHVKKNRERFYAIANVWENKKNDSIVMHRLVMRFPVGKGVDHIDGNGLNNTKSNLRIGNHSQNGMNRGVQLNNKTGYKGVYLYNGKGRLKRYWTYIWVNKKRISGGYFEKIVDAAKKYNELAIIHHAEFAHLNNIPNE